MDPASMDTNFNVTVLDAPEGMYFKNYQYSISSVIVGNLMYYSRCELYGENSNKDKTFSIFTTPNDHQKYYKCRINMLDENNKEYALETTGNIPQSIPALDFDISASNLDYDDISINTTGSFDFISGIYRETGNSRNWTFYSDDPIAITFPELPAEITQIHPNLTSDTFFETETYQGYITLNEYSEVDNYADFISELNINRYQGENSTRLKLMVKNYEENYNNSQSYAEAEYAIQ